MRLCVRTGVRRGGCLHAVAGIGENCVGKIKKFISAEIIFYFCVYIPRYMAVVVVWEDRSSGNKMVTGRSARILNETGIKAQESGIVTAAAKYCWQQTIKMFGLILAAFNIC